MKTILKIIIAVTLIVTSGVTASAQQDNRQRLSREQLAEKQAQRIAEEVAMDNATTKRFIDTYCRCQKEIWTVAPKPHKRNDKDAGVKTDEQTEQNIKARFERSQKILDIRQKYYAEYSKFLTQKQIQSVYDAEKRMMDRLGKNKGPHKKGAGRK